MKAHSAVIAAVMFSCLLAVSNCTSDWQMLNGTRDIQDGKDKSGSQLEFNYYSEMDEDTSIFNLFGTF